MVGDQVAFDGVQLQKSSRFTGVLSGYQIDLAQYIQRPQGDVIAVPDRCGDDIKRTGVDDIYTFFWGTILIQNYSLASFSCKI